MGAESIAWGHITETGGIDPCPTLPYIRPAWSLMAT